MDLLDVIAAKEKEEGTPAPAAEGTQPPAGSPDGGQPAGAEEGAEPWHKDPRFQKFLKDREELNTRLAALRASEGGGAPEPKRVEDLLPAEMPVPTAEELSKLGIDKDQYDALRRMSEAMVHNDRRAMLKGFLENRQKQESVTQTVRMEEVKFLTEAEEDFGSLGFGSLKDPNSPLWKRADVIRRSDKSLQTPQGVYRAARKALQELVKDNPSRTTDRGESLISGSQPTGAIRGGGKRLSEAEYFKLDRKAQEEYDRRSLGLPSA